MASLPAAPKTSASSSSCEPRAAMSDWFNNDPFYPSQTSFWGADDGESPDALFWYSGDVGVTDDGVNVSAWDDRANANDLTPPVGEPQVTTQNGLDAVFFQDASASHYLENTALSPEPESPFTIYCVFHATLQTSGGGLQGANMGAPVAVSDATQSVLAYLNVSHEVDGDGESQDQHQLWFTAQSEDGHLRYQEGFSSTGNWPSFDPDCTTVNKLRLACIVVNGASSALYIDDMATAKSSGTLGGASVTLVRLGAVDHLFNTFGGTLCEVFAVPNAADATARAATKTYLERWGSF